MKKGKKKKPESKRHGPNSRRCSSDSTPHQSSVESSPQQNSLSCSPEQQLSAEFTPQPLCPQPSPQQQQQGSECIPQPLYPESSQQQPAAGPTPRRASMGSIVERSMVRAIPTLQVSQSAGGLLTQNTSTKISHGSKKAEDQQGNIGVIVIPMLQVLGTAAVALGALATAYYVIELL